MKREKRLAFDAIRARIERSKMPEREEWRYEDLSQIAWEDTALLLAEIERLSSIVDAVGEVISENGEDCDCNCTAYGSPHGPDCDPCLACRVDAALGENP